LPIIPKEKDLNFDVPNFIKHRTVFMNKRFGDMSRLLNSLKNKWIFATSATANFQLVGTIVAAFSCPKTAKKARIRKLEAYTRLLTSYAMLTSRERRNNYTAQVQLKKNSPK
jgi:hypothetical protein